MLRTKLPDTITTVAEAKSFLIELIKNDEHFHPDDDANEVNWSLPKTQMPTKSQCKQLNNLMFLVTHIPGFDPYGFILKQADIVPTASDEMQIEESVMEMNYTYIQSVVNESTGGGIDNDVITLKNGWIIRIGEGGVSVSENQQNDDEGTNLTMAFWEHNR